MLATLSLAARPYGPGDYGAWELVVLSFLGSHAESKAWT
jgi:hypothetical protein